jgi:cyclohexa-1,5-dienecarbonyl-CoA hydratase
MRKITMQESYENILFEIKNDIAFLNINRPPLNVLNIATMKEINDVLAALKENNEVKVLVLTSPWNNAFSAGVDVAEHTEDMAEEMLQVFHDIFRNMSKLDKVTVAALKGLTLGGACEIAVFCDLIFAANNLEIGQPEIKLSVIPPISLLVMPRLIGLKKASELLLTGKVIGAREAEQIGLVNEVVTLESFDSELENFLKPFTSLSQVGIKYTKKGIRLGLENVFDKGLEKIEKLYLEELMASEDAHEGLKAFMEKRKPVWKNK